MQLLKVIKKKLFFCALTFVFLLFSGSAICLSGEHLIVFTGVKDSGVNSHFYASVLPEIKKLAREMNVDVFVEDGSHGFPAEVKITPLLIYQNHLGRSVYQGRTNTLGRIKNFIRTSRNIPLGNKKNDLLNIALWHSGRSTIWAPLKVSNLGGTMPDNYDEQTFQKETLRYIRSGFKYFDVKKKATIERSDRGFYMDFYPWLSKDHTLFISLALFSQFHCEVPVFELKTNNIQGSWEDRGKLFKRAAMIMEEQVAKVISDPYGGDGFDFVSLTTPVTPWGELGYPLPPPPPSKKQGLSFNQSLPALWRIEKKIQKTHPMIQFRFPAPLDNYSGEINNIRGNLIFPGSLRLSEMKGHITVDTRSVTMGEDDLDTTIKGPLFLSSSTYPVAEFIIKSVDKTDSLLEFGQLSMVGVNGIFKMKGVELPLSLPVSVELIIGEDNLPHLVIQGGFSIDLRGFDIEGATGPEPEKYTLLINLNILMSSDDGLSH